MTTKRTAKGGSTPPRNFPAFRGPGTMPTVAAMATHAALNYPGASVRPASSVGKVLDVIAPNATPANVAPILAPASQPSATPSTPTPATAESPAVEAALASLETALRSEAAPKA